NVRSRDRRGAWCAAHVRADARREDRRRAEARRDRPDDAPEVSQLPLLGLARPFRLRDLDERRELLRDEPEGALRRYQKERRPPVATRDLSRHAAGRGGL